MDHLLDHQNKSRVRNKRNFFALNPPRMQQTIRDEQSLFTIDRIFKEWETRRKKKKSHSLSDRIHRSAKVKLVLRNETKYKIFFCNSTYLKNRKFLPKK